MEKLINNFSKYHIIETLIPGFIFIILFNLLINDVGNGDLLDMTILAYFIGIVISRVSSICTKELLFKLTKEEGIKYSQYIKAAKIDKKIEVLSTDKNLYRNLVTVCLLLLFFKIIQTISFIKNVNVDFIIILLLVFLIILFSISFIKMNSKIVERANIAISKNDKRK